MKADKEIWQLFKLNRNDFNKFDEKAEKILYSIYEKGRKQGRNEEAKRIISLIK